MLVLAVGPMQSGKQENRLTFESRGFTVLDLNDLADEARLFDPAVQATYRQLGLDGTLTPTGSHGMGYYTTILAQPELQPYAVNAVVQSVARRLEVVLQQQAPGDIVVSWGYGHLVPSLLARADHILLFTTDEAVWFDRLRRRAAAMSDSAVSLSDAQIRQLVAANGMNPSGIREAIHAAGRAFHGVDTSSSDWGSRNLGSLLDGLLGN